MSCVLRAHGESFDVREFLKESSLQPDTVYKKGDPIVTKRDGSRQPSSGFSISVSQATLDDLEGQIREAISFLDEYEDELRRLGSFVGVDGISLDFGVQWREGSIQTDVFPADLLWRAGALDIWLGVTHYFMSGQKEDVGAAHKN
ncbi:MAG: DUF4279 domain-containing protein [Vicinamibacteria bacterium]